MRRPETDAVHHNPERPHRSFKLPAALAYARANTLDRTIIDSHYPRLGLVTTGKAHLDVLQAIEDLGIDHARAGERAPNSA